jgi:hypothetical protein
MKAITSALAQPADVAIWRPHVDSVPPAGCVGQDWSRQVGDDKKPIAGH